MERALLVAVRFHEGRYHGTGDWPPSPARLFQALASGASSGGRLPASIRDALDWLEGLAPPAISVPRGVRGQARKLYVPNNDLDAELAKRTVAHIDRAVANIRVGKNIYPILFDAKTPVLYSWTVTDDSVHAAAVCRAFDGLYRLGRGVDMAWAEATVIDADAAEAHLCNDNAIVYRPSKGSSSELELLCPRPGSRLSLTNRFDAMRRRFHAGVTNGKPTQVFVQPPKPLLAKVAYDAKPHRSVFELREGIARGAFVNRRLGAAATLVAEVRDRAADALRSGVPTLANDVERYLIGRSAGQTDKADRVRIVPIPSVGHEHVGMAIRRIAVYTPQSCPLRAGDLAWAFAQVAWADADGTILSELRRADDDRMADRFERRGRRWRSVTPLALPMASRRHGERMRVAREACATEAVRQALRHAGVYAPTSVVRVQREPFHRRGTRAESFAAGSRFRSEALWHAEIVFAEPVSGPLILGNGRYLGLGLMLADEPAQGVQAFSITGGLDDGADAASVAHAARRAMLARALDGGKRSDALGRYVSGHEADGSPAGGGTHRHIAIVADLPRRRILFVAPSLLQRGGVPWREIGREHGAVIRALEGMDVLRAGRAGRLTLAPATFDVEDDPLFAPARVWESITDYDVTRHRRRMSDEDALRADVAAELQRCGWPVPPSDAVEVLAIRRGPRGGLSGRLRVAFATAQRGPLIIGRTAHKGGGLFAPRPTA